MSTLRAVALAAALTLVGAAHAQLLVEVALAPAIASQLFPPMSFPASSLRAAGGNTGTLIARVPDAANWTDWEVYTATGLAASLEPGLVHQVQLDMAMAGFFAESTTATERGPERHTRIVFTDGAQRALLYVIRSGRELAWLVARGR